MAPSGRTIDPYFSSIDQHISNWFLNSDFFFTLKDIKKIDDHHTPIHKFTQC